MTLFKPPALDRAAPIVDPTTGRITPYFQRFWQNLSFTAEVGANATFDFTADIATLNAGLAALTLVVAAKAPLASPTFTGTPAAPTAAPGTSTTQIATTAFVAAGLALKADLASPTFTGDPKAPTPTATDNDTSIATTAFVQGAVAPLARVTAATGAIADTETVVVAGTIPANRLQVGSMLRLRAVGVQSNTATPSTSTYRLRIGPTTLTGAVVASAAFVNATTGRTDAVLTVEALVLVSAIGASGAALGQIAPAHGSTDTTPPAGLTAAATIDTTVSNLVEFTFKSGDASNTATFHAAVIELVR